MGSKDMKVVKSSFFYKSNAAFSTALRDTSFSRGWVRLVVQCTCGVITVVSFILIVIMSIQTPSSNNSFNRNLSRCMVSSCKVTCSQAPLYNEFEDDIIAAVKEAEANCDEISLHLNRPKFVNGTLPLNWLSRMQSNVCELDIVGGNLKFIRPDTFMSRFTRNVIKLVLEDIKIAFWDPDMLLGLSKLEELRIVECRLFDIQRNALRAVDETLKTLTISMSSHWNPANITGSTTLSHVTTVDFSFNRFRDILSGTSFTGLRSCEVLYLNSCKISAIGIGAFDFLVNIRVIYLNNNYLVTIPPGIFDRITAVVNPVPMIDLQDNLWHCDCSFDNLRQLSTTGLLLVDPMCYYPEDVRGNSFSKFEIYCNNNETKVNNVIASKKMSNYLIEDDSADYIYTNGACKNNNIARNTNVHLISAVSQYPCLSNITARVDLLTLDFQSSKENSKPSSSNTILLQTNFFIRSSRYSVIEIGSSELEGYGLLWFQSSCPHEVYCVNILPNFLRVYNVDIMSSYTFCPLILSSGLIEGDKCITHHLAIETEIVSRKRLVLYIGTSVVCISFGALCVYAIIRNYPALLKGSKRILFVKHKKVDALVLPPKLPLRRTLLNEQHLSEFNDKSIFIMPGNHENPALNLFVRGNCRGSTKSNAPSYISALQPTEDQLKEWRLKHHFNNNSSVTSVTSDLSTLSCSYYRDTVRCSFNDDTYESLK